MTDTTAEHPLLAAVRKARETGHAWVRHNGKELLLAKIDDAAKADPKRWIGWRVVVTTGLTPRLATLVQHKYFPSEPCAFWLEGRRGKRVSGWAVVLARVVTICRYPKSLGPGGPRE